MNSLNKVTDLLAEIRSWNLPNTNSNNVRE